MSTFYKFKYHRLYNRLSFLLKLILVVIGVYWILPQINVIKEGVGADDISWLSVVGTFIVILLKISVLTIIEILIERAVIYRYVRDKIDKWRDNSKKSDWF